MNITDYTGRRYDFRKYNCWHHVRAVRADAGIDTPAFDVATPSGADAMFAEGFRDSRGLVRVHEPVSVLDFLDPNSGRHSFPVDTALARIGGRPVGLLANNPQHLGGAIDAPAADKAARFMQLCNAHGLPLISLVDTPGFMVGPDAEATAQVRHVSRLFIAAAHLRVPYFSVVLRKGYEIFLVPLGHNERLAKRCLFTNTWKAGKLLYCF